MRAGGRRARRLPASNDDGAGLACFTDKPISEIEFGSTYFDGPTMPRDPKTGLIPLNHHGGTYRERFTYRSVGYLGLKSKTDVNGPDDLDLLRSDYDHVACLLIGVTMGPGFIASNDLIVSKRQIVDLVAAHR